MKITLVGYEKNPVEVAEVEFHVEEAGQLYIRFIDADGKVIHDTGFITEST